MQSSRNFAELYVTVIMVTFIIMNIDLSKSNSYTHFIGDRQKLESNIPTTIPSNIDMILLLNT